MIEIDGVAMPFEPGKQYLLLVQRNTVAEVVQHELPRLLKKQFNINVVIVRVNGDPHTAMRVVRIEEPEHV